MSRANVICHMMTSIDGKINGNLERALNMDAQFREYFQLFTDHFGTRTRTLVIGRRTAADSGKVLASVPKANLPHETLQQDFVEPLADKSAKWMAVIDPHGRLTWEAPVVAIGFPAMDGRRWVEAVVEDFVSDDFLAHCRSIGVPYLFAGKDAFDPVLFLQKVKTHIGDDAVCLMGGGVVNGTFLKANCIDELSVQTCAIVAGKKKDTSLFEPTSDVTDDLPWANFTLQKAEKTPEGALWAWYTHNKA